MEQKINYQTVKTIADRIYSTGILPSAFNVMRALNKTGIEIEIASLLNQWEVERLQDLLKNTDNNHDLLIKNFVAERTKGLENSLSLMRATLESTGDGILVVSHVGQMLDYNERFVEMWQVPRDVLEQRNDEVALRHVMAQLTDPQAFLQIVQKEYQEIHQKGSYSDLYFKDGRIFERYSQPYIVNGDIKGRVWSFRDVTQRRHTENDLRVLQQAIASAKEAIIITDNDSKNPRIIYANKALTTITGFDFDYENNIHTPLYEVLHFKEPESAITALETAFINEQAKPLEFACFRKNEEDYWCELSITPVQYTNQQSVVYYFVVIVTDITDRKYIEAQLIHQATHDYLTELPNRTILYDRISQAILFAQKLQITVGILFIDIDNFKFVNDSLGHSVGDLLIQKVAKRLAEIIFTVDTVARLGGDEFVVIIPTVRNVDELITIAQKVMKHLSKPFYINEFGHYLTVSIGISFYPKDGDNPELLISNADTAMYQAKAIGRNTFSFFTQNMNDKVHERLKIQNGLSKAIANKEFSLVYQPIINLQTQEFHSVEALLRWKMNHNENISPANFIPIAEETGLIIPIGKWVLNEACIMSKHLEEMGYPLNIAVNISIRQLNYENFTAVVQDIFKKHNIDPSFITIELTESMLIQSVNTTLKKITELKNLGLQLAIDDFGTGYSSLSYLKELSVNKLKIDRSFIQDFPQKKDCLDIVSIIIALARTFNLTVIAEGVETKEQADVLKDLGCDQIQGYYFAKPMADNDLLAFLKNRY